MSRSRRKTGANYSDIQTITRLLLQGKPVAAIAAFVRVPDKSVEAVKKNLNLTQPADTGENTNPFAEIPKVET